MANPPAARRVPLRPLSSGALLVAAGALGCLPAASQRPDPVAALAWLALLAPGAGALGAAFGLRLFPLGWLVPASWALPVALVSARAPAPLPALAWPALAWSGLFALGTALGELARARRWSPWGVAGGLLLAGAALAAAPLRASVAGAAWPPRAAHRLLDLAPDALVIESAGVDWMRHRAVYDAAGTDRLQRRAWRGPLAGPTLLLVGCLLAGAAHLAAARAPATGPPGPG